MRFEPFGNLLSIFHVTFDAQAQSLYPLNELPCARRSDCRTQIAQQQAFRLEQINPAAQILLMLQDHMPVTHR